MPVIIITDRAHNLIRANADPAKIFVSHAVRRPDGQWETPVDSEVFERLESMRFPGENLSDVIERACHALHGGGLN